MLCYSIYLLIFFILQKLSWRRIIGELGSKHMAYLPDMIPCLLHLLNDETPAVVRQAVKTGTNLFAKVLQKLVIQVILFPAFPFRVAFLFKHLSQFCWFRIQGLFSTGGIDDALKSSWEWLLKFKSVVSHMAFQASLSFLFVTNDPIFSASSCLMWNWNARPPAMKVSSYWLLSLLKKQFLCTHQILMSHLIRQLKLQKVRLMFPFIWKRPYFPCLGTVGCMLI